MPAGKYFKKYKSKWYKPHKRKPKNTAKKNARAIKKIKKSVETKMCDQIQGIVANNFDGQFMDNAQVNTQGEFTGQQPAVAFSPSLLRLDQGVRLFERNGAWVQMKSLTMKYCLTADDRAGTYQRLYMMLVLDQDGQLGTGAQLSNVLALESAVPAPNNKYALAFQNLTNTGRKGRFKILWRKAHTLSSATLPTNTVNDITQANVGSTMRTLYQDFDLGSKRSPQRVYGSVTIKRPYKLNYGSEGVVSSPINQTIRLFAWSESNDTPTTGAEIQIQYYCRFRFKDP